MNIGSTKNLFFISVKKIIIENYTELSKIICIN